MNHLKSWGVETGRGKYHEEAVYSLALIFNLVHSEISTYLNNFDLTPAQFNVLMVIKHQGAKEGISQVDISKKLIVTPSNMTRLLDKLEKEGVVSRGVQQGDRRVNVIKASEKGSKLLDRAWPGYQEKLQELLAQLNQTDQKILSGLLLKWLDKLMEG